MRTTRTMFALLAGTVLCLGTVPLPAAAANDTELRVLTFNLWQSGSHGGGVSSIVDSIRDIEADVVALQETDTETTEEIADSLGWNHTSSGGDVDIVSSYPIQDEWDHDVTGTTVVSAQIKDTLVYSVHLDYRDYGPYNACLDEESVEQIHDEERTRIKQAREIEEWATSDTGLPQIIAGDFNTPSHLDWTERTKSEHCGYVVEWPATKLFDDEGWRDSYRVVHPDERDDPAITWSPVKKWHDDAKTIPEPQDRIDLILYEGDQLTVSKSERHGGGSSWPSDHYAVLSTFTVS